MMNETGEQREHGKWLDDDICMRVCVYVCVWSKGGSGGGGSNSSTSSGSHCLLSVQRVNSMRWEKEHCKTLTQ